MEIDAHEHTHSPPPLSAAQGNHLDIERHTAYFTTVRAERKGLVLRDQVENGFDMQDIPWVILGERRESYRAGRIGHYRRHPALSQESKSILRGIKAPKRDEKFFAFKSTNRGAKPGISHFQLRYLLSAHESKTVVTYLSKMGVCELHAPSARIRTILGFESEFSVDGTQQVCSILRFQNLVMAGSFQGKLYVKRLRSSPPPQDEMEEAEGIKTRRQQYHQRHHHQTRAQIQDKSPKRPRQKRTSGDVRDSKDTSSSSGVADEAGRRNASDIEAVATTLSDPTLLPPISSAGFYTNPSGDPNGAPDSNVRQEKRRGTLATLTVSEAKDSICNALTVGYTQGGAPCVLISSNDNLIQLRDMTTLKPILDFKTGWAVNHTSSPLPGAMDSYCLTTFPSASLLAAVGDAKEVILFDVRARKQTHEIKGHTDFSFATAWDPLRPHLATGNQDQTCRVWDLRRLGGGALHILGGRMASVRNVQYTPDGHHLAFSEAADFVHIYNTKDFSLSQQADLFGEIAGFTFSPDGGNLYIGVTDYSYGCITEWERCNTATDAHDALLLEEEEAAAGFL
eukprot:CAMPEP_0184495790 /NCGR_PEP_ID=MMETSP0113_2-20130426/32379_1 /TAXON_ID=91329 /ORGANISM="Norrisiella sphaerica, Strain BC52" /LENGTH=566 /DNA_ID=CAMNT_0026882149 /DNA_START=185 /DNA_END=1885 /DNA_ORIENTATION=-